MREFFKLLKQDFERARAILIINNIDLISGYVKVKYTILMYLKWWLYCLTLPYRFVKILIQQSRGSK